MNDSANSCVDRREWLRGWLRWSAAGGISLAAGALWLRQADHAGQAGCGRAPACRTCGEFDRCQQAPAVQAKRERGDERSAT